MNKDMKMDEFERGIENIRTVGMTGVERDAMLRNILKSVSQVPSPWFNVFAFRYAPAFALILVLGFGTVSLAAERSLPGDFLYPLKVDVSEPLQGALILDKEEKVDFEAAMVERRLNEVEILTNKGAIDNNKTKIIEKNLDSNLDSFGSAAEGAGKQGSSTVEKAQFRLNAKARAHDEIIGNIQVNKDDNEKEQIQSLQASVKQKLDKKMKEINAEREKRSREGENY
jgi:hypothetical protein